MQYAPLAFPALILFLVFNGLFYGACIALVVKGLRGLSRNRGAFVYIALGLAPFVYYGCVYVLALGAEAARAREVAAWPRKPVTPATMPDTIVIEKASGSPRIARALVADGPFRRAFANPTFDQWYVYERREQADCPAREPARNRDPGWLSADACATAAKSAPPVIDRPYLRLLLDLKASYHKTPYTTGVTAGSILELRWSDNAGGEVVAFHEIPTFYVPQFPPLLTFKGFLRKEYTPGRYEPRIDAWQFVLDAIGQR